MGWALSLFFGGLINLFYSWLAIGQLIGLFSLLIWNLDDRIPSTTPGAEPPRDVSDSGSARSHSTHLETSSSDRP